MYSKIGDILQAAVQAKRAPFLVGIVASSERILWSGAAGHAAPGRLAGPDTLMRIVSMSKAIGATAAAIAVERGLFRWDTPVDEILPEFGKLSVLVDRVDGTPYFRAPRTRATLAHLATHTSGLTYEFWNEDIAHHLEETDTPSAVTGRKEALSYPLAFDPGDRWHYGNGPDWLGLAVQAATGERLDSFCQRTIFDPLGITNTFFELDASHRAMLSHAYARSTHGTLDPAPIDLGPPAAPDFYGMGHALYSTAADYIRFLRMWLHGGELDGATILRPDTIQAMLANQIRELRLPTLRSTVPFAAADLSFFGESAKSHSFFAARMEEDVASMRSAGSAFWGGVLNTHFWLDPQHDIAAVLMTQMIPFLDPDFMGVFENMEKAVYSATS